MACVQEIVKNAVTVLIQMQQKNANYSATGASAIIQIAKHSTPISLPENHNARNWQTMKTELEYLYWLITSNKCKPRNDQPMKMTSYWYALGSYHYKVTWYRAHQSYCLELQVLAVKKCKHQIPITMIGHFFLSKCARIPQ